MGKKKQKGNVSNFVANNANNTTKIGVNDSPGTVLANQLMLVTRGFVRSLTNITICGEEMKKRGFVKGAPGLLQSTECQRPLILKRTACYGFAHGFDVDCGREDHQKPSLWTCDRIAGREHYIVNMSVVLNTMLEGLGFESMNRLTTGIGVGSITKGSYQSMRDKIYHVINEMAEESRRNEAKFAVEQFGLELRNVFDGSWAKRLGDNSTTFVVQCIATETNKVIGTYVLSKICNQWKHHTKNDALAVTNKEHACAKNWEGESAGMERYGIECLVKKLLMEDDIRVSEIVQMDGNTARSLCSLTWKNHTTDAMSKPDAVNFIANLATYIWNNGHQSTIMDLFARLNLDLPAERLAIAIEDDIERFLPGQRRAVKRRDEAKKALKDFAIKKGEIRAVSKTKSATRIGATKTPPISNGSTEEGQADGAEVVAIMGETNTDGPNGSDPLPPPVAQGISSRTRNLPKINYAKISTPVVAKSTPKYPKFKSAYKVLAAKEAELQNEAEKEIDSLTPGGSRGRYSQREKRVLERSRTRETGSAAKKRRDEQTDHGLGDPLSETNFVSSDGVLNHVGLVQLDESLEFPAPLESVGSEVSATSLDGDEQLSESDSLPVFDRSRTEEDSETVISPDGHRLSLQARIKTTGRRRPKNATKSTSRRGRPKRYVEPTLNPNDEEAGSSQVEPIVKRGRGRPRKSVNEPAKDSEMKDASEKLQEVEETASVLEEVATEHSEPPLPTGNEDTEKISESVDKEITPVADGAAVLLV